MANLSVKKLKLVGDAQRGDPESAMLRVQFAHHGVLSVLVEHVGDLTHRMTTLGQYGDGGHEMVEAKVRRALGYLRQSSGFAREHGQNIRNNVEGSGMSEKEYRARLDTKLTAYAEAHRQVPVFNEVQRLGRNAAIAIGEQRWDEAIRILEILERYLKEGRESWDRRALGRRNPMKNPKMMLLRKEDRANLPKLYSQENVKDPTVWVKFFTPDANFTWFAYEFDGTDTFFGLVDGHEVELGYFSLRELETTRAGRFRLPIERDRWWRPKPLSEVRRALDSGRQPNPKQETWAPAKVKRFGDHLLIVLRENGKFVMGINASVYDSTKKRMVPLPEGTTVYIRPGWGEGPFAIFLYKGTKEQGRIELYRKHSSASVTLSNPGADFVFNKAIKETDSTRKMRRLMAAGYQQDVMFKMHGEAYRRAFDQRQAGYLTEIVCFGKGRARVHEVWIKKIAVLQNPKPKGGSSRYTGPVLMKDGKFAVRVMGWKTPRTRGVFGITLPRESITSIREIPKSVEWIRVVFFRPDRTSTGRSAKVSLKTLKEQMTLVA